MASDQISLPRKSATTAPMATPIRGFSTNQHAPGLAPILPINPDRNDDGEDHKHEDGTEVNEYKSPPPVNEYKSLPPPVRRSARISQLSNEAVGNIPDLDVSPDEVSPEGNVNFDHHSAVSYTHLTLPTNREV